VLQLIISNLATAREDLEFPAWLEMVPSEMSLTDSERAHCEANVRLWKSYLPADCVYTMIAMGWDLST
jgi:hypothetical protein